MISTYTIIAGNMTCPNHCPICISKMTPSYGIDWDECTFNWTKFEHANEIAVMRGARNVLITGKGEPTLFPDQITKILYDLPSKDFERIELQTEGSNIAHNISDDMLIKWYDAGLDLIAISIYHYDSKTNKEGFGHLGSAGGYELDSLITRLKDIGFMVRLSCLMLKGYMDTIELIRNLINFCKENEVFQLTLRTADVPKNPLNSDVARHVKRVRLDSLQLRDIEKFIQLRGTVCDTLAHGAVVYEVDGQNVSLTTGLGDAGDNRQLIFFPQGWLTTSWETVHGSRII